MASGRQAFDLGVIDPCHPLAYLTPMAIRPIITLPDEKILRQVSKPVKSVDADVRTIFDDMLETMYKAPGIGLAAVQIGVPQRLIVLDVAREGEDKRPLFLANPEVTWKSLANMRKAASPSRNSSIWCSGPAM
jgi:peptide deformylase